LAKSASISLSKSQRVNKQHTVGSLIAHIFVANMMFEDAQDYLLINKIQLGSTFIVDISHYIEREVTLKL